MDQVRQTQFLLPAKHFCHQISKARFIILRAPFQITGTIIEWSEQSFKWLKQRFQWLEQLFKWLEL